MRTPSKAEGASALSRRRDRRQLQPPPLQVDREGGGDLLLGLSALAQRQRRKLDLLGERVLLGDAAFADDAAHRRGLGETLKNFGAEILAKDVIVIRDAPNLDELWPPLIRMEHVVVDRAGPDDRDLD